MKKDTEIKFDYNNYNNLFKCIKFLLDNNYTNIIINIEDKELFNKYLFNNNIDNLMSDYVKIRNGINDVSIKDYLRYEKLLYDIVNSAINLSPLEKYIYVYNIVKQFKEYKECDYNKRNARNLYKILDNEYIVCVGYAELLSDLLTKLNINNTTISILVDTSYKNEKIDEVNFKDVKRVKKGGHKRVYVYLKDDKYKIDGFYLSDPTWDNDLESDLYNHMLFTNRKNDYSKNYQWFDKFILFNVKSICEFNRYFDFIRERDNKSGIYLLNYIIDIIRVLDPDYIKELVKKYKFLDSYKNNIYVSDKPSYKKLLDLKNDLSEYIVSKVNNIIELKIWKGIKNVYKEYYGYSGKKTLKKGLKKVRKYNEYVENYVFPDRYKIDKDGNITLIKKMY